MPLKSWQRQLLIGGPALLGLLLFLRLPGLGGTLGGFENDHFVNYLVRSSALLEGRWPLRDFGDYQLTGLWPPMTYVVPAVGAALFGDHLLTEAVLTLLALWVAAVLTNQVALQLGASGLTAGGVAVAQILISPRLYNYPKLLILAAAAGALLWFARSPARFAPAVLLGTVGALGFLFRHDLGVYIAVGALVVLIAQGYSSGWRSAARSVMRMGVPVIVLVLPGLVVAERHVGLATYFQRCLTLVTQEVARAQPQSAMFNFDWRPLVEVDPPIYPLIHVRWTNSLDARGRVEAEERLALRGGVHLDGRTWGYDVDRHPDALTALVRDPLVDDTHGFDRHTLEFDRDSAGVNVKLVKLFNRVHVLPGVLHRENAVAWLYWVIVSVPVGVLLAISCQWIRRRGRAPTTNWESELVIITAFAVVGIVVNAAYLRQPIAERIPDAVVLPCLLVAWGLNSCWGWGHGTARQLQRGLVVLAVTLSALSVFVLGGGATRTQFLITEGPVAALRSVGQAVTSLSRLPDEATPEANGELIRTARYVRECTAPTDRILVGANLAPLYYFAKRSFAGGQLAYFSNFYTSLPEQREILETLTDESVPMVFLPDPPTEFIEDYPSVAQHVQQNYSAVGFLGQNPRLQLLVERSRPVVRIDEDSGLPCFR